MIRQTVLVLSLMAGAMPALAQSLHLPAGTSGVELSAGWSVGPSSNGVETFIGASIGGKVDVGVQLSHYTLTFDDGSTSSWED